jgi:hypothetical protein
MRHRIGICIGKVRGIDKDLDLSNWNILNVTLINE